MSARFRRHAWPGAKLLGLFVFSAFPIALRITSALQFRNKRPGVGQVFVRIIAAVVLCLTPCSSLLAEDFILRCDAPQGGVSFSVSVDPTAHSVHSLGFANKVETNQFSDTVIVASSRESPQSRLMIDRITGQFQLTWSAADAPDKGGSYQGSCAPARRLF
jgi:hypothetical protein